VIHRVLSLIGACDDSKQESVKQKLSRSAMRVLVYSGKLFQEIAPRDVTMPMQFQFDAIKARKRDGVGGDGDGQYGEIVTERRTKEQTRTKKPPLYKCILLNDDYTPMEFVVEILKQVFHKPHAEATRIMLHVHQNGMGVAGVYPYEIAETKVRTVEELARESQYPLKCVLEKE
jgi:ATP-dependent Clp protease adaptor protein ClpS